MCPISWGGRSLKRDKYLGTWNTASSLLLIKKFLTENNYQIQDFGAFSFDSNDDYPDFIKPVAEAVAKNSEIDWNSKLLLLSLTTDCEFWSKI